MSKYPSNKNYSLSDIDAALEAIEKAKHDSIVLTSFGTYLKDKLYAQGLKIDHNVGENKRAVGEGANKIYPDVIVWKPAPGSSSSGSALIIEKIETKRSLGINWQDWGKYANPNVKFILVVPVGELEEARRRLRMLSITHLTTLQTYSENVDGTYSFNTKV